MTDDLIQRLRESAEQHLNEVETRIEAAAEIERLSACLLKANDQAEHFEREWYLRGDEIEQLEAERDALLHEMEGVRKLGLSWSEEAGRIARERDALRLFAGRILHEHREHMTDVDGFAVQEYALEARLLESFQATEPCGEGCECIGIADFPTDCLRYSASGRSAIDALAQPPKGSE